MVSKHFPEIAVPWTLEQTNNNNRNPFWKKKPIANPIISGTICYNHSSQLLSTFSSLTCSQLQIGQQPLWELECLVSINDITHAGRTDTLFLFTDQRTHTRTWKWRKWLWRTTTSLLGDGLQKNGLNALRRHYGTNKRTGRMKGGNCWLITKLEGYSTWATGYGGWPNCCCCWQNTSSNSLKICSRWFSLSFPILF